jgi:hypothetical protein
VAQTIDFIEWSEINEKGLDDSRRIPYHNSPAPLNREIHNDEKSFIIIVRDIKY